MLYCRGRDLCPPVSDEEVINMKYRCTVCGYEHEFEGEMPDDFICPMCGVGKDKFEKVEE